MRIRDAAPSDAAALVAFLHAHAREPDFNAPLALDEIQLTTSEERAAIEAIRSQPSARWLVAEHETGELVGQLTVKPVSTRRALAHVAHLGMSVRHAHRRRGIGRALLTEACAWAPIAGIKRLELAVYARNSGAIALYEQLGFVIEGRRTAYVREDDAYLDDLIMARIYDL